MPTRREKLEAMLSDDPSDTMTRYMLALEWQKEDANDKSLELLEGLMNDAPPYVPAFLMAGQQLAQLDRINDARTAYEAGIKCAQSQGNDHAAGEMSQFLADLS